MMDHDAVRALIARSNRLGADPQNTNYAGGNTSAKGGLIDPVDARSVEVMWVKGSGGDLGTLTSDGLAVLRLDRLRSLVDVYPGVESDDEMFELLPFCLHGEGGSVPSIDTAMHALLDAVHVDHLHPDSGLAVATATDGAALTEEIFGGKVVWVPWRRPGFQLGMDLAAVQRDRPDAIGAILGGHGITAWGNSSEDCEANSLWMIQTAAAFIVEHGKREPFGSVLEGFEPLPHGERRARAVELAPVIRGLVSRDRSMVGHFNEDERILDFLSRAEHPRLADLGSSCPDHFIRTKVRPMVLDLPPATPMPVVVERLHDLHSRYRDDYEAYYQAHADQDTPPMRGADPAIVLVPGVGMFSYGADKQTARVAGEFFVNAVNAMRGAESLSTYSPIPDVEKFRIEYWALEEAKLARRPKPRSHSSRIALVTGAASGIGKATAQKLASVGACVAVVDRNLKAAVRVAQDLGGEEVAVAIQADVTDPGQVGSAVAQTILAYGGVDLVVNNAGFSLSKSLLETTDEEWDRQHDVLAKGSFLVSRSAARVMIDQALGGDIVYISSKNSVFAGPDSVAYSAAKADQSHQVRLLAVELGVHGIRVNGINPDAVVRGSGIFAGGWGAARAAVYQVPESELGKFYAERTVLKREVLPEHVAAAVAVLTGPELSRTTGVHVPVDSGVAAAFLR